MSLMPSRDQREVRVEYTLTEPGSDRVVQQGRWIVPRSALPMVSQHAPSGHGLGILYWNGRRHVIMGHHRHRPEGSEREEVWYDVRGEYEPITTEGEVRLVLTEAEGDIREITMDASRLRGRHRLRAEGGELWMTYGAQDVSLTYEGGVFDGSI